MKFYRVSQQNRSSQSSSQNSERFVALTGMNRASGCGLTIQ